MVRPTNIMPIMIIIIFAVSIVVIASTLLSESGNFGTAQGQGNNITSSSSSIEGNLTLTSEQKAMCDPNNPLSKLKSVNTTESHICGLPKTQPSNITTTSAAANTTIRTEALPPSSPIPGLIMPEQPPSQPPQSESIQPPAAKSIAPRAVPEGNITSSEGIAPSEDKGGNCIAFLPCFNAARGGIIP
ncbi:MAG: hypothetical protein ACJ708_06720 [Nitrososphaeraceae archaeon]